MPALNHSPADVARWLLVGLGLGSDPSLSQPWPAYIDEPDAPDSILWLDDTAGRIDGRLMPTGEVEVHKGLILKVRDPLKKVAYQKIAAVVAGLLETTTATYPRTVAIGSNSYCVYNLTLTSDVMTMGKETSSSKRSLYSANFVIKVRELT